MHIPTFLENTILELLEESDSGLSAHQLAQRLGEKIKTITLALNVLLTQKRIRYAGAKFNSGKAGKYRLINQEEISSQATSAYRPAFKPLSNHEKSLRDFAERAVAGR